MSNAQNPPTTLVSKDPKSELAFAFQQLADEIFSLNNQLLAIGDRLSNDKEVSTARWQILATIRNEALTAAEIARRRRLRRQSVQETVQRLQQQNLVEFHPNPRHSRAQLVKLTQKGKDVINALSERQIDTVNLLFQNSDLSLENIYDLTKELHRTLEVIERFDTLDFITDFRKEQA